MEREKPENTNYDVCPRVFKKSSFTVNIYLDSDLIRVASPLLTLAEIKRVKRKLLEVYNEVCLYAWEVEGENS